MKNREKEREFGTLHRDKVEILALNRPFLLLLFSGARLELHSNASLSIPVTPGNTVP